jgi:hypothetical protein
VLIILLGKVLNNITYHKRKAETVLDANMEVGLEI